jgi:hypothetical protein
MAQALGIQGWLVITLMTVFLVEARDFILANSRFYAGRFQEVVNAGLKVAQCYLLETRVADTKSVQRRELNRPSGPDRTELSTSHWGFRADVLLRLARGVPYGARTRPWVIR